MKLRYLVFYVICILVFSVAQTGFSMPGPESNMVLIPGGSYEMGDVFDEGDDNESPVHNVTVSDFFISKYEITVADFRIFTEMTGYVTSAEKPVDIEDLQRIMKEIAELSENRDENKARLSELYQKGLEFGGTGFWDVNDKIWGWSSVYNWREPGFLQEENHPAVCLSWEDAVNYCNWLSEQENLPPAYCKETGELLDEEGNVTFDISAVRGYRLPTEAEWEYSARERGKDVRFGNGKNIADAGEICFDGEFGDYTFLAKSEFRKGTVTFDSLLPNSIGLYNMSGNAWEWCSDYYGRYSTEDVENPLQKGEIGQTNRVLRGGRWGGNAFDIRVFAREGYDAKNRCNNSGFRIARSK